MALEIGLDVALLVIGSIHFVRSFPWNPPKGMLYRRHKGHATCLKFLLDRRSYVIEEADKK